MTEIYCASLCSMRGGVVALLELNRPKAKNALNGELLTALTHEGQAAFLEKRAPEFTGR